MGYTHGVTGSPLLQTLLTQTDAAAAAKTARAASAGMGATQDSAAVSTAASALRKTVGDDAARSSKVEALRAAVSSGTYQVPAGAVADKLLQSLLQP